MKTFEKVKFYFKNNGLVYLIFKIISYPFLRLKNLIIEKKIFKNNNNKDIFSEIYKNNYWAHKESRSGSGSSLKSTENIRLELPLIIQKLNIKSIVDIPSGDFFWFSKIINNLNINYIGGDIVQEIIDNNRKFENKNIKFKQLDLINDLLPDGDLLICRDCLAHFSYEDIKKTFRNISNSKFKYILITNHDFKNHDLKNKQIKTGLFRLLDFNAHPFNFKKNYINEIEDPNYPKNYGNRKMLIYSFEDFKINIEQFLNT